MADAPESSTPSSVFGKRLAVTDLEPATATDLGLEGLRKTAFEFQSQRNYGEWNELAWLSEGPDTSAWVRDIHAILGVIGELVLVAIGAEIEQHLCQRARDALTDDEMAGKVNRAALAQSLRFFAEGEGNYIVVAGHGLANLTLRTMMLDPQFVAPARQLQIDATKLTPGSNERGAWVGLNAGTATTLHTASQGCRTTEFVAVAEVLRDLMNDQRYATLLGLRNEQYHRWRGEAPGVSGVNFSTPSAADRLARGEAIQFGADLLSEYVEGEQVLADVIQSSKDGLRALDDWMPKYLAAWNTAFEAAKP